MKTDKQIHRCSQFLRLYILHCLVLTKDVTSGIRSYNESLLLLVAFNLNKNPDQFTLCVCNRLTVFDSLTTIDAKLNVPIELGKLTNHFDLQLAVILNYKLTVTTYV